MSRVTEHLMRAGSGSLAFLTDVPLDITDKVRAWVDENDGSGAVGAHIVITSAPIDSTAITAATLRSNALYAGPITDRPSRTRLEFTGLKAWLDECAVETDVTRSAGTPTQWVGDLVKNGLSAGTAAGGGSNVTRTIKRDSMSYGEALDAVASTGGWEYEIQPDGTIDFGTIANLFGSTPSIVITDRDEGPDGAYRGVEGSLLDQALTQLGPNLSTAAVALGAGAGDAVSRGTDTTSRNLKTFSGGTPTLIRVVSAPSDPDADLDTTATNYLNLQGMRRQVNVATSTPNIRRLVKPGEYVYLHDLAAGLFDTSEQIIFRGETITPAKVRCLSLSWPITQDYGVYVVQNAASPEVLDVTRWVDTDDGDAFWTIGDWSPPGYGPANRSNPLIEERIAAPATSGEWESFTPSWGGLSTTGATQVASKRYTPGFLEVLGYITFNGAGLPTGSVTMTVPDSQEFHASAAAGLTVGEATFADAGTASYRGSVRRSSSTEVVFNCTNVAGTYPSFVNISGTVPFTWAASAGDAIVYHYKVPI